jgi:hypothetical protein
MTDHDQRFKLLLHEFFAEFFRLFFPQWADRFDFDHIEWLDKEVFFDPPQGEKGFLDLVAKLPTRQAIAGQRPGESESWIALLHVEIEYRDSVALLRPRFLDYYHTLRKRHRVPVLPIGLFLRVGLDGLGWDMYVERVWELPVLWFAYQYVGLPGLDGQRYVQRDNWLGVALATLMEVPEERRAWLAGEALRRLQACPEDDWRKFLLSECVQAYANLNEAQQREFEQLLETEPYRGVKAMGTTWFEQGEAKGEAKGLERGKREMLQLQLEELYGPLSPPTRARLASWSPERLAELGRSILRAKSLKELGLDD